MGHTKSILVITMLSVTASTNTKAPARCPAGYGWAPELNDCMDCVVCDTMPATSICPSCKGEESSVVPSEISFQQVEVQRENTANFYQCPSGYEWHPVISDCMSCGVCDDMPDTEICDRCAEANSKSAHLQPGVIAVITILALVTVCSLSVAAWFTRKKRGRHDDDESEARQPIQVSDAREKISGIETVV
ncbi:uncharacterized protein [Branchiostoma lanceolatum]|uniref:uncharacterized protein isoform X2 n=1 Tax=Branchiostoma lanceolatum TaxID=7740 RepID=UPI003451F1C3